LGKKTLKIVPILLLTKESRQVQLLLMSATTILSTSPMCILHKNTSKVKAAFPLVKFVGKTVDGIMVRLRQPYLPWLPWAA
jgi:hypothetical protein